MPHAPAITDIQKSTVFVDVGFEGFCLRFYFTSKLRRARFESTLPSRYDEIKKALGRLRGIKFLSVDLITALDNYARVEFDRGRKIMIVENGAEIEYADMLVIKIACK